VAEQDRGSDDPRLAAVARHALHDEELVAAFAANDVDDPADVERARSFVDRCAIVLSQLWHASRRCCQRALHGTQ